MRDIFKGCSLTLLLPDITKWKLNEIWSQISIYFGDISQSSGNSSNNLFPLEEFLKFSEKTIKERENLSKIFSEIISDKEKNDIKDSNNNSGKKDSHEMILDTDYFMETDNNELKDYYEDFYK